MNNDPKTIDDVSASLVKAVKASADLSDSDKESILSHIDILPDEIIIFLNELFFASPGDVKTIFDNVKRKEEILASGSKDEWNKILEEEKQSVEAATLLS